jgi:putative ABC transport system permease protein
MTARRVLRVARIALRNAWRFRLQSTLMIFAACFGVAGMLVSAGYADSGRQKILDRFTRLGTNVVTITPRQSRAVGGRARTGSIVQTLTEADYKAVAAVLDDAKASSATISGTFRIRAGDLTKTTAIVGVAPDYFRIKHWSVIAGAMFDETDMRRQARIALLGYTAAKDLFGTVDPTGQRITINRVPFVVDGVLAERGQGLDAVNEDEQVYVPLPAAMHRLMNVGYYDSMLFELADGSRMDSAVAAITTLLHHRHQRFSPAAEDFQVQNQKSLIDAQLATFGRLAFLIGWIALSTLVVAALGIWGITWIGVRNRTREIGARRAIGAKRTDVLVQFLSEALAASLFGCFVGAFVAYLAVRALDAAVDQPFLFDWATAVSNMASAGFLFAAFVAIAAGRAAMLDPISALRTE